MSPPQVYISSAARARAPSHSHRPREDTYSPRTAGTRSCSSAEFDKSISTQDATAGRLPDSTKHVSFSSRSRYEYIVSERIPSRAPTGSYASSSSVEPMELEETRRTLARIREQGSGYDTADGVTPHIVEIQPRWDTVTVEEDSDGEDYRRTTTRKTRDTRGRGYSVASSRRPEHRVSTHEEAYPIASSRGIEYRTSARDDDPSVASSRRPDYRVSSRDEGHPVNSARGVQPRIIEIRSMATGPDSPDSDSKYAPREPQRSRSRYYDGPVFDPTRSTTRNTGRQPSKYRD